MDFMDPQVYSLLSAWYAFYEEHCLLRSPLLCSVSSSDPPPPDCRLPLPCTHSSSMTPAHPPNPYRIHTTVQGFSATRGWRLSCQRGSSPLLSAAPAPGHLGARSWNQPSPGLEHYGAFDWTSEISEEPWVIFLGPLEQ